MSVVERNEEWKEEGNREPRASREPLSAKKEKERTPN